MITNGSSYLFVKTLGKQYGISDLFATRSQYRNKLCEVLRILKHLGKLLQKNKRVLNSSEGVTKSVKT